MKCNSLSAVEDVVQRQQSILNQLAQLSNDVENLKKELKPECVKIAAPTAECQSIFCTQAAHYLPGDVRSKVKTKVVYLLIKYEKVTAVILNIYIYVFCECINQI